MPTTSMSIRLSIKTSMDHPMQIVWFWRERGDQEARKALGSNRLGWEVIRMVLVYRHRWTGIATLYWDGTQQVDLGDCQVRYSETRTSRPKCRSCLSQHRLGRASRRREGRCLSQ